MAHKSCLPDHSKRMHARTHGHTCTHTDIDTHMQVFCSFHHAAVLVVLIIVVFKVFMRHKSLVYQDHSVLMSVLLGVGQDGSFLYII